MELWCREMGSILLHLLECKTLFVPSLVDILFIDLILLKLATILTSTTEIDLVHVTKISFLSGLAVAFTYFLTFWLCSLYCISIMGRLWPLLVVITTFIL